MLQSMLQIPKCCPSLMEGFFCNPTTMYILTIFIECNSYSVEQDCIVSRDVIRLQELSSFILVIFSYDLYLYIYMHTSSIMLQIHSYWHGDLSSRDQWSHHMKGLHLTTGSNLSIPSRGTMQWQFPRCQWIIILLSSYIVVKEE